MSRWPWRTAILALAFFFAALLGWSLAYWQASKIIGQQDLDLRRAKAALRCVTYWNRRSGRLDATFEFRHGRRGLLQAGGGSEGIEPELPGVRDGVTMNNVRQDPAV